MSSCTFATPRVGLLQTRRAPLSARSALSSSSSSLRAPSPSCRRLPRYSADARARRVVAASANGSCTRDLLVVGPGVLGSLVCQRWLSVSATDPRLSSAPGTQPPSLGFSVTPPASSTRRSDILVPVSVQKFPAASVVGQTNTDNSHDRLLSIGVFPRLKEKAGDERYPFVVFSAPPSGSEDYAAEVEAALKFWDGDGAFVFTSSTAVYAGKDGEPCDESTPQFEIGESPRADRLLKAEAAVLAAGGSVVRLAGLYHSQRGAHMYFMKTPSLASNADGLVNLIHYEDAAAACVDVLVTQFEGGTEGGEIFLATDGVPVSRKDMVECCLECDAYEGNMPEFTEEDGPLGKSMNNPKTREKLGWAPVHESFAEFVAAGAKDSFYPKRKKNPWT